MDKKGKDREENNAKKLGKGGLKLPNERLDARKKGGKEKKYQLSRKNCNLKRIKRKEMTGSGKSSEKWVFRGSNCV